MGWLWTCLGGGPSIQSAKSSKSHRGKISNQPHDLRLQPLPTQLPRHGYGVFEPSLLQEMPSGGKCGEPDNMEAFKIPTTSVNTCISINTLKKASERSLESSFRREFGLGTGSDVDELKQELAALRRRLANEEAEAKKLREEVNYLRSCGVLQRSEDSAPDSRINQSLLGNDITHNAVVDDESNEKQRQGDIAPVKQLRKCFSGPMLFDVHSPARKDSSESAMVPYSAQARISSHRVGLSPKPHSFAHIAHMGEVYATHQTRHEGEEGVVTTDPTQKISKVSLSNNLQHYPSTKVAAWTSQTTGEGHHDGTSKDLVILDSMDVHWIEVANAPCASGFSTNVRRDHHHSRDHAESPRRPSRAASTDASGGNCQKLIGKRRQSKRSMDLQEPTEKRSREQSLVLSNQPQSLTPEQIEEQLSQAVAAFRQQKLELEAKHQASFCPGPSASSNNQPSSHPGVVGVFRNSRKKSLAMRNRGFQRSLSPVKEALSVEEITWSRQGSSRNESISAGKPEDSSNPKDLGSSKFLKPVSNGTQNQGFKFSAQILEISPTKSPKPEVTTSENELDEKPSAMENIAMVPIQCASPSLSPKKRSSSAALDALCALAVNSKTPAEGRYLVHDNVEGLLHEADWIQACEWDDDVEGMDINPIECASPSFSDRRKSSRAGPVRQSISFDPTDSSPLMASSNEFLDGVFRTNTGEKSTPSPSRKTPYRSPGMQARSVTPSPQKHWTPSPQKDIDSSLLINERSWYCDAIDAIQSINDLHSSKELRLVTESVSLGNSPAKKTQRRPGPRNPHAFSAEKKILRRAFSWYVSEHDERMRTFGLKERFPQRESEEPELNGNDYNAQKPFVPDRVQFREPLQNGRQPNPISKRGVMLHTRRFSDSDSGGSATFSIDLTRADSSQDNAQNDRSQNQNECGGLDTRDINTSASFLWVRADKENSAASIVHAPNKNSSLRTSDQSISSSDLNKYLKGSQEAIPENRSVLGSVPFNHWDKRPINMYNEDTKGERHPTISQPAGTKPSSRGVPAKILMRTRSFM